MNPHPVKSLPMMSGAAMVAHMSGSPLIPVTDLWRLRAQATGVAWPAVGEVADCAFGGEDAEESYLDHEACRLRLVTTANRQATEAL